MPHRPGTEAWSSLAFLAILAVTLGFGWWPFDFLARNHVHWNASDAALQLDGAGLLYSRRDLDTFDDEGPASLEFWLRPDQEPDDSLPCLAGLYQSPRSDQLLLGQWKDSLILRQCALAGRHAAAIRETGVGGVLRRGQTIQITLTSSSGQGLLVYTNGVLAQEIQSYHLFHSLGAFHPRLVLGATALGTSTWHGAFKGVAVFRRVLDPSEVRGHYLAWLAGSIPAALASQGCVAWYRIPSTPTEFIANAVRPDNPLLVPSLFRPITHSFLVPLWRDFILDSSYVRDMAVNLFGFMPLGAAALIWLEQRRRRAWGPGGQGPSRSPPWCGLSPLALRAWGLTAFLSLLIESGQVLLPTRDSQMSDLMLNATGGWAGVVLAARLRWGREYRGGQMGKPSRDTSD